MTELFNFFFDDINFYLGAGGIFLIFSAMLILGCVLCTVFLHFFEVNRVAVRLSFLVYETGVCFAEWAISVLCKHNQRFVLLQIALGILLLIPIICIKKRKKVNHSQKELIEFIDQKIREEKSIEVQNALKKQTRVKDFCERMQLNTISNDIKTNNSEIDFTQVKSVIDKLNFLTLSADDKRQVQELTDGVLKLEAGDKTTLTKSKVSDGLGELLKIMSKYGV